MTSLYFYSMLRLSVLLFCFLVSGCSSSNKKKEERTVFRYNEATGIATLDPAFANDQAKIWACNHLFNGLVRLDDALIPQPCIAKSWDISDDGLLYTFHLRTDVFFHEHELLKGRRKVTAHDFIYSFSRVAGTSIASPGAWVFRDVAVEDGVHQFKAINDSTFTIKLKTTFPPFLGLLSMPYCSVVPHEVVHHYGKDFQLARARASAARRRHSAHLCALWRQRVLLSSAHRAVRANRAAERSGPDRIRSHDRGRRDQLRHPGASGPLARRRNRGGDQEQAYRATNQGEILSLSQIRARISVPGAQFVGVEFGNKTLHIRRNG